jgi:hypothetical protein
VILCIRSCRCSRPLSSFDRRSSLPVVTFKRPVLRARMVEAYVSRKNMKLATKITPQINARTQNTQRQPFASARYPQAIGPTIGPTKGPIEYKVIATPRRSCFTRSAIVPPPSVRGAAPAESGLVYLPASRFPVDFLFPVFGRLSTRFSSRSLKSTGNLPVDSKSHYFWRVVY